MKQAQVGWLVRILASPCVVLDKDPFVDVSKGHLVRRWGERETQGEDIAAHGETVGVLDGPRCAPASSSAIHRHVPSITFSLSRASRADDSISEAVGGSPGGDLSEPVGVKYTRSVGTTSRRRGV